VVGGVFETQPVQVFFTNDIFKLLSSSGIGVFLCVGYRMEENIS